MQIIKKLRADGSFAYLCRIEIRHNGQRIRRNRTFDNERTAVAWAKREEKDIRANASSIVKRGNRGKGFTLGQAIDRYVETSPQIGRTKTQVLRTLRAYPIADMLCDSIKSPDLVMLAEELGKTRGPSTVLNYMSHLSAIFALAKPAWGMPLEYAEMQAAQKVCTRLRLTKKSTKRNRRPSIQDLDQLINYFQQKDQHRQGGIPMAKIIVFALFSTRRQEEICTIRWDDLDTSITPARVLVRDMKHPGDKMGNDTWCELPPRALAVIETMPRLANEIFPFNHRSISAAFTRACKFLAIENLRFHDLRHEGVSILFEQGRTIPMAAAVSGHRSWSSLQRYEHIRTIGNKYESWKPDI